jgi:hypothetical protein
MPSYWAKDNALPLSAFPEYSLKGIFKLSAYKGIKEGFKHPLLISPNKDEVKQFIEDCERRQQREEAHRFKN